MTTCQISSVPPHAGERCAEGAVLCDRHRVLLDHGAAGWREIEREQMPLSLPQPYYDHAGVTIYQGDAREILPRLGAFDAIITDPVWPNAVAGMAGADDPTSLLRETLEPIADRVSRVVLQLGCDSDPRFLSAVPPSLPFLRACWLEYVRPHYKGRLLYTSDLAYAFGTWPPSQPGAVVIPGKVLQNDAARREEGHPCPRQYQHVRWLVRWFARGVVVDPFCGTGTTLQAAKELGLPAIGIEVEERYCAMAARRLRQDVLPLFAAGEAAG